MINRYELIKPTPGLCYWDAVHFAEKNAAPNGKGKTAYFTVVHGRVRNRGGEIIDHAWVNIRPYDRAEVMEVWNSVERAGKPVNIFTPAERWYNDRVVKIQAE